MMFHILTEGSADTPTVEEIMRRKFGLVRGSQFRVYPHQGKGKLPADISAAPDARDRTLLGQLPAKLRAYSRKGGRCVVVVLVDQDDDDCGELKQSLVEAWKALNPRPARVLFRIAMEECEAWLLADRRAVEVAYPAANWTHVPLHDTDLLDDPSDVLARVVGCPIPCSGADKAEWSTLIAPHLDLDNPKSPSLRQFIGGILRHLS